MADFDYANARLRAMKSRLFTRQALEALAEAASVHALVLALADTAYREAVQAALARYFADAEGTASLAEALRIDLINTLGKARSFFGQSGAERELSAAVFGRYDLHNVKTVLRGLARHIPASEILANTLPVGELRAADLAELAQAAEPGVAIDLLATWGRPEAPLLLELRGGGRAPGGGVLAMELALERWHLKKAMQAARDADQQGQPLLETLMMEADAMNVLTALRLVGQPDTAAILREHFGGASVEGLFVGPGHIPFGLLLAAAQRPTVAEAVNSLSRTAYGTALTEGAQTYAVSSRLSAFERALARQQLRRAAEYFAWDPLGIGILLGYVALKTNEVANIRAIAQGLALGAQPGRIRAELVFLD